jgi:hypothetical protein
LLGAKGSAKPETIAELANATITEDFQGIMAWYSTVRNGLQYAESWDASRDKAAQEAFIKAMDKFRAVNIYG